MRIKWKKFIISMEPKNSFKTNAAFLASLIRNILFYLSDPFFFNEENNEFGVLLRTKILRNYPYAY